MALRDAFEARYSAAYRARISNPDVQGPNLSQDDDRVDLAVTDALAEFETKVQVVYDADDDRHVRLAVRLVEITLLEYGSVGAEAAKTKRESLEKEINALRDVTGRGRFKSATSSRFVHTEPTESPRPPFEDQQFDDLIPRPPGDDYAGDD